MIEMAVFVLGVYFFAWLIAGAIGLCLGCILGCFFAVGGWLADHGVLVRALSKVALAIVVGWIATVLVFNL